MVREKFAAFFRALMLKRGYKTQKEFAEAYGMSEKEVSRILSPRASTRLVHLSTVVRWCEACNVKTTEVIK